jgi:GNAT superfamily N-acetyltransferase
MTITVREANGGDVGDLVALNQFVQELHVAALPSHFKHVNLDAATDWFRAMLARNDVQVWLASSEGTAVGYAVAVLHSRPENPFAPARSFYELDQVSVSPRFRRQGVARELVQRVVDDAKARGVPALELSSWSFNSEAHAAFAALGFRPKIVRFCREVSEGA